jgi:hypothetical protein
MNPGKEKDEREKPEQAHGFDQLQYNNVPQRQGVFGAVS